MNSPSKDLCSCCCLTIPVNREWVVKSTNKQHGRGKENSPLGHKKPVGQELSAEHISLAPLALLQLTYYGNKPHKSKINEYKPALALHTVPGGCSQQLRSQLRFHLCPPGELQFISHTFSLNGIIRNEGAINFRPKLEHRSHKCSLL